MENEQYQRLLAAKLGRDLNYVNKKKRAERLAVSREKGTHIVLEWELMKVFFGYNCVRCEGASGLIHPVKDHIIPIYQGGSDSLKNLQPLCAKCNCSKGPENTDWRLIYCENHNLVMPDEWRP